MCLTHAKFFYTGLLLLCVLNVSAQTSNVSNPTNGRENNPYSKYGIGELLNSNNASVRGMGNLSSTYANPYEVNSENPASFAFIQRTTFELGGTASIRTLKASGLTYKTGTTTVSYLSLGFPVHKNAGISFGFKPYTHVYYNMVDTLNSTTNPVSPIGQIVRSYNGEGGLNTAYFGAGYKLKEFSIGVNMGYTFGTINSTAATVPIDTATYNGAFITEFNKNTRINGFNWKVGVMYEHKLDSQYTLRLGGTFAWMQSLTERYSAYEISTHSLGDTLLNIVTDSTVNKYGQLTLPMSFTVGAMLARNNKWGLGVDFAYTDWSGFKSTPNNLFDTGVGKSSYKISLGGEITPDVNNLRSYLSRVTYRLGFYYGVDYVKLYNTTLPCYGVTAGVSLPFKRSLSRLNMAIDLGRLGTNTNNLIQQSYVRFTLGITISDRWFIPRKYD